MLVLNASEVNKALPMDLAVAGMKEAFAALSSGNAIVPIRLQMAVPTHNAVNLFMPAYLQRADSEGLAVKIVTVYPENPARDLPVIHAAVLVLEADTGRTLALLEGGRLTALRTGAAGGAATDLLARKDSKAAAIFGAGVQGRTQLEAVCTVRAIEKGWIYDPDPGKSQALINDMAGKSPIPKSLYPATSPREALAEADIICTATTSSSPVFSDGDLKPGTHINAIGAFTPEMREIPSETVARARVYVDSREACLEEAGDLIYPLQMGMITPNHIHGEIGEVVLGTRPGRQSPEEITMFKSVGIAVQDVIAAQIALGNARELGLGEEIKWE